MKRPASDRSSDPREPALWDVLAWSGALTMRCRSSSARACMSLRIWDLPGLMAGVSLVVSPRQRSMLAPNMPSGPQKGRVVTLVTVYAHHDFAPASDMAGAFHCGSHCCNTRRCQLDSRRAFHSLRPVRRWLGLFIPSYERHQAAKVLRCDCGPFKHGKISADLQGAPARSGSWPGFSFDSHRYRRKEGSTALFWGLCKRR